MGAAAQPTALDGPTRFSDPKCQQCGGQEALVTVYIVNLRIVSCFGEAALIQNNKSLGHRELGSRDEPCTWDGWGGSL